MRDLYADLGVAKDATDDQIKAAWRAKALQNHTDQGGNNEAFLNARAAYETLRDPKLRAAYGALATGLGNRYCRAARKRARRMAREEAERRGPPNMIKRYLLSALLLIACDPAQEISSNAVLDTCSDTSEKHVEFLNVEAITYTLPAAPKVNCGITYAILGGSAVTFSGGTLSIKGDGQPVSTSLVRTTAGTGRLVWNGLRWVHIGGG